MKTWIPAIFINIVVVIIIFILTACDSNYTSHQLKRAETIMNENPDSALMILESLSKGNLIISKTVDLSGLERYLSGNDGRGEDFYDKYIIAYYYKKVNIM